MAPEHSLWRAVRWPLTVLLVGALGVAAAIVLDEVHSSEWWLTIGALSLSVLAAGAVWLVVVVVAHLMRGRRAG